MDKLEDYWDIIEELDANANLDRKSQDFIISLVDEKPRYLSPRQVEWLKDLQQKHLL
jgi:hypothetical protein